jgi:MHS family proline/betaine transporter-like MFS transporter
MATNLSQGKNAIEVESWYDTAAGVMGNVLEWYDFALFGYFSDIIAQVFFAPEPEGAEHSNLIKTFAIFGGAFLMRPIGGLLIGYVGDKHGRKTALTRSLFLMAIPTTLMGCLPTYETAGIISPILLALCRLLQGISVGGQLPASLVYTVEKRDRSVWGYYGSLPMVAANVGTLLGNLCAAFMRQFLSEEQLLAWGWRLPFFSGILIAFVACYLQAYGAEVHTTAGVYDSAESVHTNPIKMALRKGNRLALLEAALVPTLWASGFYVSFVWMAIFMDELLDPPVKHAFWINIMSMLLGMTFMLPVAGALSDRVGRVRLMTIAAVALSVLGPILLIMISKGNSFVAFLSQLALGVMLSFFGGPLCAWLVENFSPEVRLTSASLGYDLAHAIAGGFAPLMATALFTNVGTAAPGLIYSVFGITSIIGIYITYFFGGDQKEATSNDLELREGTAGAETASDPAEKELPEVA